MYVKQENTSDLYLIFSITTVEFVFLISTPLLYSKFNKNKTYDIDKVNESNHNASESNHKATAIGLFVYFFLILGELDL